jgi:hypothetical protein
MNRPSRVVLKARRDDQGQTVEFGYTSAGEFVMSTIAGIYSKTVAIDLEKAKKMASVIRTNKLFTVEFDGNQL